MSPADREARSSTLIRRCGSIRSRLYSVTVATVKAMVVSAFSGVELRDYMLKGIDAACLRMYS